MPFDTKTPLIRLATVVAACGVQQVGRGAPESIPATVSAYVTVGGMNLVDKAGGLAQKDQAYLVTFQYRIAGQEANAEDKLCDFIDAFVGAMFDERRDQTSALYRNRLSFNMADEPQYQPLAVQEVRLYPVIVLVSQQQNVPITTP